MTFELVTIPCLSDNYDFLLHRDGKTALIDAAVTAPIEEELNQRGWGLDEIWITHHDWDHIDGVDELRRKTGAIVRGAAADVHRLPKLDIAHQPGDVFEFAGAEVSIIDVPGHTLGHVAYYVADAKAAFTGDSLMALGCGRVVEGTLAQMYDTLMRLNALPGDTRICSGHEYTKKNGEFARTIEANNPDLEQRIADFRAGNPTMPTLLSLEQKTNPFLRAGLQSVKDALNMSDSDDADVFAEMRRRRNSF